MDNRRKFPRFEQRLPVRYTVSADKKAHIAFTCDVGAGGLSITSHKPEKPGARLALEVELPDGRTAKLEGNVQWYRTVPGGVHSVQKGAFGVRIHYASEHWYHFMAGLTNE